MFASGLLLIATYFVTAKSDLYWLSVLELVYGERRTLAYAVTKLLDRKGTGKIQYFHCQVRHEPMNWGRAPQKIEWNWEKPLESGDSIEVYKFGGATE